MPERSVAVIEGPDAGRALRHGAGERHADRMIARGKIVFAFAVALARLQNVAEIVEAQIADDVLGPTEARAIVLQPPLGGENAVAAAGRHLAQEIGFLAEQAKPVLHLPDDVKIAGAGKLRERRIERRKSNECGENDRKAHGRGRR